MTAFNPRLNAWLLCDVCGQAVRYSDMTTHDCHEPGVPTNEWDYQLPEQYRDTEPTFVNTHIGCPQCSNLVPLRGEHTVCDNCGFPFAS